MKKWACTLLCAALLLVFPGCGTQPLPQPDTGTGSGVVMREIDMETDTLLGRVNGQDTDYEAESAIFLPLMRLNEDTIFPQGSSVSIPCPESWQRVEVYDHLLREEGYSWFNRLITDYTLVPEDGTILLTLDKHFAASASSDSEFLQDGSLRGFRLVAYENDEPTAEYAFVLHVQ